MDTVNKEWNIKVVFITFYKFSVTGCLSLDGVRKTKRWERIEVEYQDREMKKRKGKFSGFTAQIIQHEIDHCNGIII